jgi:hypothetical protein
MKKQILSEQFRRMQKLAGIINEGQEKYPKGFSPYTPTKEDDENYDGKVLAAYTAPMDGWDTNNSDTVVVVKDEEGFWVDGYLSFGDFEDEEGTGPFKTQKEAEDKAYDVMEDIVFNWEDNDDEDDDDDDDDD